MDVDTIITSNKINDILNLNSDFMLINTHISFIKSNKYNPILNEWLKEICNKIIEFKNFYNKHKNMSLFKKIMNKNKFKKYNSWDYLGNSILNKILENNNFDKTQLDKYVLKALPEMNWAKDNNINSKLKKIYQDFYFKNDYSDYALEGNGGIICLHNSWTKKEIIKMDKKEFLQLNNTMSKIFKKVL